VVLFCYRLHCSSKTLWYLKNSLFWPLKKNFNIVFLPLNFDWFLLKLSLLRALAIFMFLQNSKGRQCHNVRFTTSASRIFYSKCFRMNTSKTLHLHYIRHYYFTINPRFKKKCHEKQSHSVKSSRELNKTEEMIIENTYCQWCMGIYYITFQGNWPPTQNMANEYFIFNKYYKHYMLKIRSENIWTNFDLQCVQFLRKWKPCHILRGWGRKFRMLLKAKKCSSFA